MLEILCSNLYFLNILACIEDHSRITTTCQQQAKFCLNKHLSAKTLFCQICPALDNFLDRVKNNFKII